MEQESLCNGCATIIIDSSYFEYQGQSYHEACFNCTSCKSALEEKTLYELDQNRLCEECYARDYSCAGCQEQINETSITRVGDKSYHQKCHKCSHCQNPLGKEQYYLRDESFFCLKCFYKLAVKCRECQNPIEDGKAQQLGDNFYHRVCLKCSKCKQVVKQERVYEMDSKFYHEQCLNTNCALCKQQLNLDAVLRQRNGDFFHVECQIKSSEEIKSFIKPRQVNQSVYQTPPRTSLQKSESSPLESMNPEDQKIYHLIQDQQRPRFTLKQLQQKKDTAGIDPLIAEYYLHDEEFQSLFQMTQEQYLRLVKWKRGEMRKKYYL